MKEITLTELINRLQCLSKSLGNNSKTTEVRINIMGQEYCVTGAMIATEPDYNFDEANCGPDTWVELNVE